MTDHQKALNKAKIALMAKADSAFFTTLAFSLKHQWSESVATAATDGTSIYFNPGFFMKLSKEEQVFLIVHEAMHVALLHIARVNQRDKQLWNAAADYVINLMLTERGFTMPQGGLLDSKYAGLSTDQVYDLLKQEQKQSQQDPQPAWDDLKEPTPETAQSHEADVQDILVRASIQSKMAGDKPGTIPGDVQIFLDKLLNPKLPWQRILQKYIQALSKSDFSFRKPNRRYFPEHYLPSFYSESLVNIAVAIDASASVSDHEFQQFVSEVASIFKMMKPEKIDLVEFDTDIRSVHTIKTFKDITEAKFIGRGGTRIGPVLDWAKESKPNVLLVFSDGHFRWPFKEAHGLPPIVWLINNHKEFQAPFGKTIHYEV